MKNNYLLHLSKFSLFVIIMLTFNFCEPMEVQHTDIKLTDLEDGVYEGTAANKNKAVIEVEIKSSKINSVTLISLDATKYGRKAKDIIPERIVEEQTPFVDAVSGATEASNVIINATINALNKAKK